MRRTNRRQERVTAMIKTIVAGALTTKVKDPRVGFVTVTSVSVTNDLSLARIRLSIMGDESEKALALEGMDSARGFLRTLIARQLDLRTAPELRFEVDRSLEYTARIDELLADSDKEGS
jgi:ribosome-binding factor A